MPNSQCTKQPFLNQLHKRGRRFTVAQKGHTCKLKMLLQTKNFTCKLKIGQANQKLYMQTKKYYKHET